MNEMNATATKPANLSDLAERLGIDFIPIEVSRGRKFRGRCFWVSEYAKSNCGYAGSGVRPLAYYPVSVVIVPGTLEKSEYNGHVNSEDVIPWDSISKAEVEAEFAKWIAGIAKACIARCGSDMKWRANYMRKVAGGNAWGYGFPMNELEKLC